MSTQRVTPDPSSTLGSMAGAAPTDPQAAIAAAPASAPPPVVAQPDSTPTLAKQPTSRLGAILSAVAGVASTALAGTPAGNRPSFIGGMAEGARAEQQAQANQQAIKFKSFDDQVRLAQLHAQDQKMQLDNQAQQDAHTKAELDNRSLANDLGVDYDTIANHGPAVMDHLTAQTAATGGASVPAGTHVSADGENIYIPKDAQQTRDGQKKMYSQLAPALGLPSLADNVDFVPPKLMNMLTNKVNGFGLDGNPIKHDDLPGVIGATQAQRDNLAKNGGTPAQLQTLDNVLNIYKANLDALDKHAASVTQQQAAAKAQGEADVANNPTNQTAAAQGAGLKAGAVASATLPSKIAAQNNASANAAANAKAKAGSALDSVAFDPTYQNPDGTKGANVVMSKGDAQAKGLQYYKSDPSTINGVVAGMNDVQNKLNQLADVANDPKRMSQVNPALAAAMLAHGKGIEVGAFSTHLDLSRINENLYADDVKSANQATRDFVTAYAGAHEAITQLPRLQTFGKSSRMTQQQMEAAQNLLPQPGDGSMAAQKMSSLQTMIDPLRKQIPKMPGADTIPSWLEQQQRQNQRASGGSVLGGVVSQPTQ